MYTYTITYPEFKKRLIFYHVNCLICMICDSNHYIPSCTSLCFEPITQFMVFSSLSTRYARVLIILMFNKERLLLIDQLAYSRKKFNNKYDICLVITYFSYHLRFKSKIYKLYNNNNNNNDVLTDRYGYNRRYTTVDLLADTTALFTTTTTSYFP